MSCCCAETHMPTLSQNLERLAGTFTVRDIMVNADGLVCAESKSKAFLVSQANLDFNLIPIRIKGRFTAYFLRDSKQVGKLSVNDLVSDGTGILDLVDILAHREFAFVLGPRQIDGYVHYSDLNHHLVKLSFYVLLEAIERFALDSVRAKFDDDFLQQVLGQSRFQQVKRFYKQSGDAGQSVINYLNIADVLKLAKAAKSFDIENDTVRAIKCVRDGAAHVSENLVSNYDDVRKLADVKRESMRILGAS